MNITTKFKLGDKIWVAKDYRLQEIEVKAICIDANENISYGESPYDTVPERFCYSSKNELITSI